DEVHNLALKAELMEKTSARFSNYKKDMSESSYTIADRGRFTPGAVPTPSKSVADQAQRSAVPNNNHVGTRPATVVKEASRAPNPYTKLAGFKCYKCDQPGHHCIECPARRSVNFVDVGEDGEEE
ncbi:zf-CCHC domain-containing, partial, partial [Olea europaea subsp. europaea]